MIAAVNGFALGGGCETAMACTIRVVSEHAKFGQPEVTLGLLPGGGGTQRLPRLVGKGRALQLILSGEMIDAQEACRIGLVNEVVPAAEVIARAESILKRIFANGPVSVRFSMEAVNKGLETSLAEGLSLEASLFGLCAGTDDKSEGTETFLHLPALAAGSELPCVKHLVHAHSIDSDAGVVTADTRRLVSRIALQVCSRGFDVIEAAPAQVVMTI